MNKTIAILTSAVAVLGLGAAWILGFIEGESFGTISVAVLGAIYGIYTKYENNILTKAIEGYQDQVTHLMDQRTTLVTENRKLNGLNKQTLDTLKVANKRVEELESVKPETPVVIEPVITTEDAAEVVKPKRKRNKK